MNDTVLIDSILTGGGKMEAAIDWFYRAHFNMVYKIVSRYKLNRDDALDAYADAVIQLKSNILRYQFKGESKCSTYFFSILRNKSVDIVRKNKTNTVKARDIAVSPEAIADSIDTAYSKEDRAAVLRYLEYLSDVCRSVLLDWNDEYTMEEIAARNGLLNAHTARSKRYNCFKQLMELVKANKVVLH